MFRILGLLSAWLLACAMFASCNRQLVPDGLDYDPVGEPILFSSGNMENLPTKASVPYMEDGGRFVCKMYYKSRPGDTDDSEYDVAFPGGLSGGTQITAWLKVDGKVGNSLYWSNEYPDVAKDNVYGLKEAPAFYWQNRLTHAFLAVADFNRLKTNKASTGLDMEYDEIIQVQGKDNEDVLTPKKWELNDGTIVYSFSDVHYTEGNHEHYAYDDPHHGEKFQDTDGYWYRWSCWYAVDDALYRILYRVTTQKVSTLYYAKSYDLSQKSTETVMSDQPDPIQALTEKKPDGATQEANRVELVFRHQFSQVQVNLKTTSDEGDVPVKAENIISVELVGVTRKGYVYVQLNPDGTVRPTDFQPVNKNTCPDLNWSEPDATTSFAMFERELTDTEKGMGYIKSFEAIAFGRLDGIRIKWKEDEVDGGTVHNVMYKISEDNLKILMSGYRYVYNMELRRGTLALVRTIIKDWVVDETDYSTNGTIVN